MGILAFFSPNLLGFIKEFDVKNDVLFELRKFLSILILSKAFMLNKCLYLNFSASVKVIYYFLISLNWFYSFEVYLPF